MAQKIWNTEHYEALNQFFLKITQSHEKLSCQSVIIGSHRQLARREEGDAFFRSIIKFK